MCFTHGPKTSLLSLFCLRITSFAVFSFIRLKFFWFIPITLLLLLKSFAKYMLIEILITLFNNSTCLLKRRIKSKWWDYFSFRIRCQMVLFDQSSYYDFLSFIQYKSKQKVILNEAKKSNLHCHTCTRGSSKLSKSKTYSFKGCIVLFYTMTIMIRTKTK